MMIPEIEGKSMKLNVASSILWKFVNLIYEIKICKSKRMNRGTRSLTIDEFKQVIKNKENLIQMFELEGIRIN